MGPFEAQVITTVFAVCGSVAALALVGRFLLRKKELELQGGDAVLAPEVDALREEVHETRAQLAEEKNRLIGELRGEVATLSVLAAERLVRKSIDADVQKTVLDGFLKELESKGKKN